MKLFIYFRLVTMPSLLNIIANIWPVSAPNTRKTPDVIIAAIGRMSDADLEFAHMGEPTVKSQVLQLTYTDPASTVPRFPDCRLRDLDSCCGDVWGPHWWEMQTLMLSNPSWYIHQFEKLYGFSATFDPVSAVWEDFVAPMKADYAVIIETDAQTVGGFLFRCVVSLPLNSLLGFVSMSNQKGPAEARWTRRYRVLCIKYEERPELQSETIWHDMRTGITSLGSARERRHGRCKPKFETRPRPQAPVRNHKSGQHPKNLENKRKAPEMKYGVQPKSVPYDPTVLVDTSRDTITKLPRMEVPPGGTRCLTFPLDLLLPGTFIGAHTTPVSDYSIAEHDTFFDEVERWDINTEEWSSRGSSSFTNEASSIEMYTTATVVTDPTPRRTFHLETGPMSALASEEVRRADVDIDLAALLAKQSDAKVTACTTAHADSARLNFWLEMSRISEGNPSGQFGALEPPRS